MLRVVRRRRLLLTGPDASAGVFFVDRRFDVPYRSADCLEIPRVDHAGNVPGVENGVESGVDGDAVNVASVVNERAFDDVYHIRSHGIRETERCSRC